jgi:hypothetical protein
MGIRHVDSVSSRDRVAKSGCYLCLKNRDGLVDLDIAIIGEGRLMLCDRHAQAVGRAAGCISKKESAALKKVNDDLEAELRTLRASLEERNQLIADQSRSIEKLTSETKQSA